MKILIQIGVMLFLFITIPISNAFKIEMSGTFSLLLLSFVSLSYFRKEIKANLLHFYKTEMVIILLGVLIIITKLIMGDFFRGPKQILFFILIPMVLSTLFKYKEKIEKKHIRNSILFFFVIECCLGIYEKIYQINVFPFVIESEFGINTYNYLEFRSSALMGHPLMNALIVSMILGYIIISDLNIKTQIFFLSIGFLGLLSFNARSAILIWILLLIVYFINILRKNKSNKLFSFFLIALFVGTFLYFGNYLISHGFGGRLLNNKLIDGSALTRLDAVNALKYIGSDDFIFGNAYNYMVVMDKMGAAGIENSFIVVIMNYGIFFSIFLFISYYYWIKEQLFLFFKRDKYILIISFLVLGSTNNGLAAYTPWIFFILCNYAFRPNNPK